MITSKEVIEQQIKLQKQMQNVNFNVVVCGNCGCTLIHKKGEHKIKCICGEMDLSHCSDLWY